MGVQINGSEGNVIATKGTFSGDVGIGGTLTYEDVTNIDSVGLITARSGIEIGASPGVAASISVDGNMIVSGIATFSSDTSISIADKIVHTGDTNTTIRFPSADTFTVETAGSERFRIASNGEIGIGNVSNPDTMLHILMSSNTAYSSTAGVRQGMKIFNDSNVDNGYASIELAATDGDDYYGSTLLSSIATGTDYSNDFAIQTRNAGNYGERLRIKSDGKVLIGGSATTTSGLLNVKGSAVLDDGTNARITLQADGTSLNQILSTTTNFGSYCNIAYQASDHIFKYGGNELLRIKSNGNIGLGLAAPTAASSETTLHIYANEYPEIHLTSSVTGSNAGDGSIFTLNNDSSTIIRNQENSYIRFDTNGSNERARIGNNGYLKAKGACSSYIDTSANTHEFMAHQDNTLTCRFRSESSTGYGQLVEFNHSEAGIYAFQVYNYSNSSNRMYIRTDGDLENINNSYSGISDVKLKENIVDANSQWDDLKALKVRNFNFKSDSSKMRQIGLVAQEAEAVCPSLVKNQPDLDSDNNPLGTETKVLKYSVLYMKAIKALQEAQSRIETLEADVAALKSN